MWAPWRLAYVAAPKPPGQSEPCFLCQGLAQDDDRRNLIALRTPLSVVTLNRYPYNNGHLLVAPQAHVGRLDELTPDVLLDIQTTLQRLVRVLDQIIRPEGYNVGLNLGRVAGAGLPGHLHWHLVPRWPGDTNFMSVVSDVRVISQSLDALYDLLTARLRDG
jgi:ATP adenylyltransferase